MVTHEEHGEQAGANISICHPRWIYASAQAGTELPKGDFLIPALPQTPASQEPPSTPQSYKQEVVDGLCAATSEDEKDELEVERASQSTTSRSTRRRNELAALMKYWDDEPVTSCTSIAYAPNAKAESSCSPTRMTSPPGLNLSHQALSSQLNATSSNNYVKREQL
ncbi:hypothetical protein FA09DRAFT_183180 [Tilletiopsis washingtonensis]|uniref:BRCT domain-containing protein n=1 Tax=Tilletiopsis washingtonensis TaxID=58919 RepID=A0A316ZFN8_9BASI|nr:hypothetical protein FA09DRAFT_183180 [Tilletiopsis washingtonensis]PWO00340.1 hypothetical protein FA09DRAFT_183180 [Tilletiopsis washingtonensis]